MKTSWLAAVAAALGVTLTGLFASCGGTAVIDPAAGGGGAAGGTAPTTTSSGAGPTTMTNAGGSGAGRAAVATKCEQVCALLDLCVGSEEGCVEECTSAPSPECTAPFTAHLDCLLTYLNPAECEFPPQCDGTAQQWNQCEDTEPPPPCGPMECYQGEDGSCGCAVTCSEATYSTKCQPGPGSTTCECYTNDVMVAACSGASQPEECSVYESCCGSVFFGW